MIQELVWTGWFWGTGGSQSCLREKIIGAVTGVMLCATPVMASEEIRDAEARERYCMAEAILFEAGNQPLAGKVAVGEVIMNRVRSSRYPNTVCDVIYEGPVKELWKTKQDPNLPASEITSDDPSGIGASLIILI